jgi:hypothetical protein
MGLYKNFTMVVYCVARWAKQITEAELETQIDFFQKYVGVDKVYLETFRGELVPPEQLALCKRVFEKHGIHVSGGITTVTPNLSDDDTKRQRLFETFCYSNKGMRDLLKRVVEYTAENFDEFIIDDFFFTQCTCEDCQKEKGTRSWEQFRLAQMAEVSENLVIAPAKKIKPNINIIIKYPNWRESYQETGYNPAVQKDMFDMIYTGTETRHPSQTDQHLPRYLSYSLMRYMENVAPLRNGGGWLDPYECYPIDTYLEQAYLTAFSKPREIMLFCWPSLYNNKVVTPLGFRLKEIDAILPHLGKPCGTPVYLPFNSQGEDHMEDYLGMLGIPFEPVSVFPPAGTPSVFLTASSLHDAAIVAKLKSFVSAGGKAIVTSGFIRGALENPDTRGGIEEMTSIRFRGRTFTADEFHISALHGGGMVHRRGRRELTFPLLEHRNNASWSLLNAGKGDHHESILLRDTFGRGELVTLVVPGLYSELKSLPEDAQTRIRAEFAHRKNGKAAYISLPGDTTTQVSLFTYDNNTIGLYSYTADFSAPELVYIHGPENAVSLKLLALRYSAKPAGNESVPEPLKPLYKQNGEAVFEVKTEPGSFAFYEFCF